MAITALSGPLVVFGQSAVTGTDNNPDLSPSMFWGGAGFLDPRYVYTYNPGEPDIGSSGQDYGWLGFDNITTLNAVPYTAATAAIVASANPPAGGALTLALANSATTGVALIPNITRADNNQLDTGVNGLGLLGIDCFQSFTASIALGVMTVTANAAAPIAIGSQILTTGTITNGILVNTPTYVMSQIAAPAGGLGTYLLNNSSLSTASGTVTAEVYPGIGQTVQFGQPASMSLWNPQSLIARAISVTAATGATYTTATVQGYDVYSFPMVEQITLTAGGTANGKKAWKYIRSITLSGGTADTTHAYSVGTLDIYGFPMRTDSFTDVVIHSSTGLNPAIVTSNTGFTAATLTTPTATTGDVRGTYALQTPASTGANKLVFRQFPQPYLVGVTVPNSQAGTGLYGLPQYANF